MNYITVLQEKLQTEIEHSQFLEKLLKALYGDGWEKLTLYDAKNWQAQHESIERAAGELRDLPE